MGKLGRITGRFSGFGLAIIMVLLASCSETPKIAGLEVSVSPGVTGASESPMYRNLADLPQRPTPVDSAESEETVRSLAEERAKAADEAERLRKAPFATPPPGERLKLEE